MTVSVLPLFLVDMAGSLAMIILAFFCLRLAIKVQKTDRDNVLWTYLVWVCIGLFAFAVSRSVGHIIKQILILTDQRLIWETLSPYSGAVNTLMFILVGAITLFFDRIWLIYRQIQRDKNALEKAHAQVLELNHELEARVTERTRALAISEQKYRRIFELSRDMIVVTDWNAKILDMNPACKALITSPENKDQTDDLFLHQFFPKPFQWESLCQALEKDGFIANAEVIVQKHDCSKIHALVSGSIDQDKSLKSNDCLIHFVIRDIEKHRNIEQQMAQTHKLASIGELASGIAHEINNPLNIILGYTQLLRRQKGIDPQTFEDLTIIEKHVKNCKFVVEDLLNFARSSKPAKEQVNVHDLIDDVLVFVSRQSEKKQIRIICNYEPQMPQITVDGKKIKQVFMNLISNAQYAISGDGTITITTRCLEDQQNVAVTIKDTGQGIEPGHLSRVFDPFFTTKPTGDGTGLGLSVSFGIVKSHGGEITVNSEIGKGAEFTIILPIQCPNKKKE